VDAAGRGQQASYGWLPDRRLAIIEVAAACGLAQLDAGARNPLTTTSAGVGTLIRDALDRGARQLIIGLGGSATNDAGAGMITELGARLLDATGRPLLAGGAALAGLAELDVSGLDPRLSDCILQLAGDVDNPLLGPSGASAVFGPQKGADPAAVALLDVALARWAEVVHQQLGRRVDELPGSGAAGGLGAAFFAFTDATMRPGVELVAEVVGLADQIARADLVLTGEGRVDGQTHHGKTPWGVAVLAHRLGKPVIVFGGQVQVLEGPLAELALALVSIVPGPCTLAEALAAGPANLANAAETALRLWTGAGATP
jgi:glycerate kinase